jgi:hypothetical protein
VPRHSSHPASPADRLSRLEEALAEGQERRAQALEAWARKMGRLPTRKEKRRWEKRWRRQAKAAARRSEREAWKAEREAREEAARNPFLGWVYAAGAVVTLLMALRYPRMWWLIFIAVFVFGQMAARQLIPRRSSQHEEREAAPLPEPVPVEDVDPRMARVDALCDKLLAEVRSGPGVLREVVHAPEQTVEALRRSCHALAQRERELRALSSPEDERRLADERAALVARLEAETDAVVKERFTSALAVLDEQRNQRAELATAASRLEAEHTRLYYTLEHLYTQVLRVRTADAASEDVAGAGLRQSVEQLGAEMEAVTEALEEVHHAPGTRVPTR